MIEYFLNKHHDRVLRHGTPQPLWISCWNAQSPEAIDLLLEKLNEEDVNMPGPDGMEPLAILAKWEHFDIITKHKNKFGLNKVLEMYIALNDEKLFPEVEKLIEESEKFLDIKRLQECAIRTENLKVLRFLMTRCAFNEQGVSDIGVKCDNQNRSLVCDQMLESINVHSCAVRRQLGVSAGQKESFLCDLTKKYPLYNSKCEKEWDFGITSQESLSVSGTSRVK